MTVDPRKIAILGVGKTGEALLTGLLSSGWRTVAEVSGSTRRQERADELRERHSVDVTLSNAEAVSGAALGTEAQPHPSLHDLQGAVATVLSGDSG